MKRVAEFAMGIVCASCATGSGSSWIDEQRRELDQIGMRSPGTSPSPMPEPARSSPPSLTPAPAPAPAPAPSPAPSPAPAPAPAPALTPAPSPTFTLAPDVASARLVGTFRNTYYDFPRETDYAGATLSLMSASCRAIATVPRAFYEAVCVQGSGTLAKGKTVSFARRDCECAEVCPRTGQRICFEPLSAERFPWGRGAAGRAIIPFETVAADTSVLALGTPIYVPDFDGVTVARADADASQGSSALHDGCFVVEDRGVRVQGAHVDVFTGRESSTATMNRIVPSNRGVRVFVGAPRCERLRRGSRGK